MTAAATLRFGQFLLELGNGASPEVFAAPCGLTSRGWSRKAQTAETNVPDCGDPDLPSWLESDIVSYSSDMTGAGVVDNADYDTWEAWLVSGAAKNLRITLDTRQWRVSVILAEFTLTGQKGQKMTFNVSLKATGAPVRLV
jgi:hypothetical protein